MGSVRQKRVSQKTEMISEETKDSPVGLPSTHSRSRRLYMSLFLDTCRFLELENPIGVFAKFDGAVDVFVS